jgi:hypothetical protein
MKLFLFFLVQNSNSLSIHLPYPWAVRNWRRTMMYEQPKTLEQAQKSLHQFQRLTRNTTEAVGMGALRHLVDAVIKIGEEVAELKNAAAKAGKPNG